MMGCVLGLDRKIGLWELGLGQLWKKGWVVEEQELIQVQFWGRDEPDTAVYMIITFGGFRSSWMRDSTTMKDQKAGEPCYENM